MHGQGVSTPVSQVDIYPTLMELLGLAAPGALDGASLVPLLADVDAAHPPAFYTSDEHFAFNLTRYVVKRVPGSGHIWKLAAWERDDTIPQMHQLYNLTLDPGEYTNRIMDPHFPALIAGMRDDLRAVGLLGPSSRNYSVGAAGTAGVPALTWSGVPALGARGDLLIGNSSGTSAPALLVIGLSGLYPGPKSLSVTDQISVLLVVPPEGLSLASTLPAETIFDELPVGVQVVQFDTAAPKNIARSRGLSLFLSQ
jgi:hypothetical protein